ncbi:hypothetical protein BH10BAC5_BH10BAC5_21360 [soil metagenome]
MKIFKVISAGALIFFFIAPALFSQTVSKIEFHYFSGITSQDSYEYDMTVNNSGSVDLVFHLRGLNENGEKISSYNYSYVISNDNWEDLLNIITTLELNFPGIDSSVSHDNYGVQLFRSKIFYNDNDYYKFPVPSSSSKATDTQSLFYSRLKSLIPENIAVDFFANKKRFYKDQRGE